MDEATVLERTTATTFTPDSTRGFEVVAATAVFRVVRGELCVGLPFAKGPSVRGEGENPLRVVPTAAPNGRSEDGGLADAAATAAARATGAREIVRIAHAGVRAFGDGNLAIVSWATARPLGAAPSTAESLEADENFIPLGALPELDDATRSILSCAFDAFLDATLADALTRRLLPRHILFRKTDGFTHRSPFQSALDAGNGDAAQEIPIFVGLLPDPFPLSALRELYERLLDAPLDRGNFRRQFHEIIALGPIQALPIFERGVPHRAGQLFTFDRQAWDRFAST
ncbi:MAG: NrtR DNA-binding winged helix domain-containing protein [Phycisphaerales bacterium]